MCEIGIAHPLECLATILVEILNSCCLACLYTCRLARRCPITLSPGTTGIVIIVHVTEKSKARTVGKTQCKHPAQVLVTGTVCSLCISYPTNRILLFEPYIHIQWAFIELLPGELLKIGLALIYLYLVYHICRQVVERHTWVALEKILSVDKQRGYLLAIIHYNTIILEFNSRQLLYECIEHRAVGHLKGIGVVDYSIATHNHLYFRCPDSKFIKIDGAYLTHICRFTQTEMFGRFCNLYFNREI